MKKDKAAKAGSERLTSERGSDEVKNKTQILAFRRYLRLGGNEKGHASQSKSFWVFKSRLGSRGCLSPITAFDRVRQQIYLIGHSDCCLTSPCLIPSKTVRLET
jgi:hypothetical protein